MFNLGGGEILVILLLALIVLGPQRLPEAARKLGNAVGEVRRMATGFQSEIKAAFDEVDPRSTTTTSTKASTTSTTSTAASTPTPTTTTSREHPPAMPAAPAEMPGPDGPPAVMDDVAPSPPDSEAPGRDDAVA
jgi:sec-independent protein translocase protein TatB